MFEKAREKYKDGDNKLLVAKMIDKYNYCRTKNKITYTDFLNLAEISIVKKILEEEKINNYIFYGGRENADREVLLFYPEKFSKEMVEKNFSKIFKVINIKLPVDIIMEHREYLSGIMKLQIKREKFGDILTFDDGADIIALSEIADVLANDMKLLTRFRKSTIELKDISELRELENSFEEVKIIVAGLRLDCFVAEIINSSRENAKDAIEEGRVFVNSVEEYKASSKIELNDIITVRGRGKFIFESIEKETKSGRLLVVLKKYK